MDIWETRVARVGGPDAERDPDALYNVCHSGVPMWFNDYLARGQRMAYRALFNLIPPVPDGCALDVGCGAGRWCRFLNKHGYMTTGIEYTMRSYRGQ